MSRRAIISVDGIAILEAQPDDEKSLIKIAVSHDRTGRPYIAVLVTPDVQVEPIPGGLEHLKAIYPGVVLQTSHIARAPEPSPVLAVPREGRVLAPVGEVASGVPRSGPAPKVKSAAEGAHPSARVADIEDDGSSALSEWVHGALDLAGFVPGFGEVADGVNAIIYLAEGRYAEAAISAAAMIPIVGDAGKVGKYGVKIGKEVSVEAAEQSSKRMLKEGTEKGASSVERELIENASERAGNELERKVAQGVAKEFLEEAAESRAEKEIAEAAVAGGRKEAAQQSAEKETKDKATPRKKSNECEPTKVCPHKGGNARSNACADRAPPNVFPGCDVKVGGKHFDALGRARDLWEVKVHRFSRYPAPAKNFDLKQIVITSVAAEALADLTIATRCGFRFVLAVADAEMFDRLKPLLPPGLLRHVPEC